MKSPRWLTLAVLALAVALTTPARAQWAPGGTRIGSPVALFGNGAVDVVPDGRAGALIQALTFGASGFGREMMRVGPDGGIPTGWPSTAIPVAFLTSGLAADGTGGAYMGRVRQGPSASLIVVWHLLADGSLDPVWPAAGRVVADLTGPEGIQLASDGGGGVYAVFEAGTDQASQLGVLRLDATGAASPGWPSAGVTIAQASSYISFGDVQATSAGVYVKGYLTSTFPGSDAHDAFIGHVTPAGTIPAGWGSGTVVLPFLLAGAYPPPYTVDPAGGLYYTWGDGHVGRLVHLLADASPDPAWPVRGLALLADTTHYEFLYQPVSDGAGGCFARFDYDSAGTSVSLVPRLVHITAQATPEPGWPLLGGRLPYVYLGYGEGDLVPDGLGGAYATWFEEFVNNPSGSGYRSLRAHHVAFGGVTAPYWPATGMTLASGTGARFATKTVTDTHAGVIAVWMETRTEGASTDTVNVYALGFGPDGSLTTSVGAPRGTMLGELRASPVPSRGPTNLVFALARTAAVRLDVLDLTGRRIRRLLEGTFAPGPHSVAWDGLDDAGRSVPPGVYLAHANGDGVVSSARLVRVR